MKTLKLNRAVIIIDVLTELRKYGLDEESYQRCLNDIDDKLNGYNDMDWSEIADKYGITCHPDTIRKGSQSIFGGKFRSEFENSKVDNTNIDEKLRELKKERVKLQTANMERNRIDRVDAKKEMYYEAIGNAINTLPLPEFKHISSDKKDMEYVLTIADVHYGATFKSENNEYSRAIAKDRFEKLLSDTMDFIADKKLSKISVLALGDLIQGILRVSDLKLNDTSVVKCVVEVSNIIATFLNDLSTMVEIDYYHVPSANHTQMRNLGTKASELADEDLEYIMSHYIKDMLRDNDRVNVHIADEGKEYIKINVHDFEVLAMHGHQIKNIEDAIKDLSTARRIFLDYLLLGHYHSGKQVPVGEAGYHETSVLISNSFIGSDPYADSLFKGCKGACNIYGFDKVKGHTESYKLILN